MNELTQVVPVPVLVVLALLGSGGLIGAGKLVRTAFLQALTATAGIQARQEKELAKKDRTIDRLRDELEETDRELRDSRAESGAKDILIARLRAMTDPGTQNPP